MYYIHYIPFPWFFFPLFSLPSFSFLLDIWPGTDRDITPVIRPQSNIFLSIRPAPITDKLSGYSLCARTSEVPIF